MMRILVLTNRIPYPLHDGGNLAVHNLLEGLVEEGMAVSLLSMNTKRHWVDEESLPVFYKKLQHFKSVPVDNSVKISGALSSLIKNNSYNIQRFISEDFANELKGLLAENTFDVILLEGLYVTPYLPLIRSKTSATIAYRQHNVEFEIWERNAAATSNPAKKWYLQKLAKALKAYELRHMNDYDIIFPISSTDEAYYRNLGCSIPMCTIPFFIAPNSIPFQPALTEPLSVYHIGAMDWKPNADGIKWFLSEIWPKVAADSVAHKLYLAGRNMPDFFFAQNWPQVQVLGEVTDATAFEKDKSILVVPLRAGGGIRVKILQAMAMGKAVVTTSMGLQGIVEAKAGEHLLIADSPADFAEALITLLHSPELCKHLGENASKLIRSHYNRALIIPQMIERLSALQNP